MPRANRFAMGFAVGLITIASSCGDPGDDRLDRRPLDGMITAEAAVECLSGWVEGTGAQVSVGEELGTFRIELALAPRSWEERAGGLWNTPCFLGFDLRKLDVNSSHLLEGDEPIRKLTKPEFDAGEIGFLIRSNALNLRLDAGAELPETLRLVVSFPFAERRNGVWRPLVGGHAGDGIAVPAGTQVEIEADVVPNTLLRFFAIGEPLALGYKQLDQCLLTFRVHMDDELVFEETEPVRRLGNGRWHEVALPPEGKLGARLRFSIEGPPAKAAFYQPSLGPRWTEPRKLAGPRPDLMLIVLDTLRADALSFHGGDPQVAPALNAFTEECVRFSRAWSSASWTLPSHASMLSGLHPEQHATVLKEHSLAPSHFTLAEHLQEAGYRTGAVTEGLFVARRHGLDQGFEFFFENSLRILPQTLEKAQDFLEADDGRPSFLLLHTYRVHSPYRLGIEEDSTDYRVLMSQWDTWRKRPDREQASKEFGAKLGELYYGGVNGLDLVLGPWLEYLQASGFYDRGFVILTSDHGDELMDHGNIGHGGRHWEELTHIPMLARGMDLVPQTIDAPATLVDLAPTFSRLAGLEPPPSWMGTCLFELEKERVVFTFNSGPRERWMAVHSADRKVFSTMEMGEIRAGRATAVFDLGRDPLERDDRKDESPAWASELLMNHADAIEDMLSARSTAVQVELNEKEIEELRALGYGGD